MVQCIKQNIRKSWLIVKAHQQTRILHSNQLFLYRKKYYQSQHDFRSSHGGRKRTIIIPFSSSFFLLFFYPFWFTVSFLWTLKSFSPCVMQLYVFTKLLYYTNSTTVTLHTILPAYYAFYNVLRFFPCKNVCFVVPTKTQTVRERILLGVCLLRRRFWYYFCVYFFLLLVSLIVHPALYRNNFCLYILLRLLFWSFK